MPLCYKYLMTESSMIQLPFGYSKRGYYALAFEIMLGLNLILEQITLSWTFTKVFAIKMCPILQEVFLSVFFPSPIW